MHCHYCCNSYVALVFPVLPSHTKWTCTELCHTGSDLPVQVWQYHGMSPVRSERLLCVAPCQPQSRSRPDRWCMREPSGICCYAAAVAVCTQGSSFNRAIYVSCSTSGHPAPPPSPPRVRSASKNLHTANSARATRPVSSLQKKDAQVLQHALGTEPARRLLLRAVCWWQRALQTLQMR